MRRVSLLNSCVLICFRPNNSTFTIHITVLYLFRSHPRHNSCIQFVSLRRVQPTYIFVHSEVNPKYLMPLYSVSTAFNITKFMEPLRSCVTTDRALCIPTPQVGSLPTSRAQYLDYPHRPIIATCGQMPFNGIIHHFPLPPGEDTNVVNW